LNNLLSFQSLSDIFGENGPLSTLIHDFKYREGQLEFASAIEDAINNTQILVAEAGTGVGKTFAYLIPALLSGKKIIVSTGTKNLQDQLFYKDIPLICKALNISPKISLLKGRANYLCHDRLASNLDSGMFSSRDLVSELQEIKSWSNSTAKGDINELDSIPEDSFIWSSVTSTTDNCLGQECSFIQDCFIDQF